MSQQQRWRTMLFTHLLEIVCWYLEHYFLIVVSQHGVYLEFRWQEVYKMDFDMYIASSSKRSLPFALSESSSTKSFLRCKNLELRICCAYRNSKFMLGGGGGGGCDKFVTLIVKYVYSSPDWYMFPRDPTLKPDQRPLSSSALQYSVYIIWSLATCSFFSSSKVVVTQCKAEVASSCLI